MGVDFYEIDPHKCTECVGHFDEPQCVQICPVECIPINPGWQETREQLQTKYVMLISQAKAVAQDQSVALAPTPENNQQASN